jgi:hypothetical protein
VQDLQTRPDLEMLYSDMVSEGPLDQSSIDAGYTAVRDIREIRPERYLDAGLPYQIPFFRRQLQDRGAGYDPPFDRVLHIKLAQYIPGGRAMAWGEYCRGVHSSFTCRLPVCRE